MTSRLRIALVVVLALALPTAAQATVPGRNGRIVFDADHGRTGPDIYSMRPNGSHVRKLTDSPQSEDNPAWSPSGKRIVYVRTRELWVMRADGSHQHRITHAKYGLRDPAWSPRGRRILYATEGRREDIWSIRADGKQRRKVTHTEHASEFQPAWAPDGKRIAFVRDRRESYKIVLATPEDTSEYMPLAGYRTTQLQPSWSPSGTQLVFANTDDDAYIFPAAGGPPVKSSFGISPVFSPDGRYLAASEQNGEEDEAVIVRRLIGSKRGEKISPFPFREYADNPDWKPRG